MAQHRIRCGTVWGGVSSVDLDVSTSGLTASVYSSASDGDNGGDIYYFSVCSSDKLTRIALADLRGHGDEVVPLSAWLYELLEQRMNTLDGSGVLEDLNRIVYQQGFKAITTAAVIGYYLGDSNLYYCYAGHPPLLVQRSSDSHWKSLPLETGDARSNLPLGILPEMRYEQAQTPLLPGDRLFLYTDGVVDCPDPNEEGFGEERLVEVLEGTRGKRLPEIKNSLLLSMRYHAGRQLIHDDVTFMILDVHAPKSRSFDPVSSDPTLVSSQALPH